jgi:2,3-bisphosphoglycerate-independent phosphoglycerate mutase
MRCILLLLDGLGDRSHSTLNGRTPLQAAHTPNLDKIASLGMNGLFHAYLQGTALPSELAHFLMFGYRMEDFPGRGFVEALGDGLDIRQDDVALLARIFSVTREGQNLVLRHEKPSLEPQDCLALLGGIRHFSCYGVVAEFFPTGGSGGILRLRGKVSKDVTDSNPIIEGRPLMEVFPLRSLADDPEARNTASFLNAYLRWSHRTLSEHPLNRRRLQAGLPAVNAVGTQRAGRMKRLPSFVDKWGLKGLMIASGAVYHGLGQTIGMETRKVSDTGDPGKDLQERLAIACEAKAFDFVHVHTKVADEAAHTKNPLLKKQVIESVDAAIAYAIEKIVPDDDILFVVTADHSTASTGRMIHTGETVPMVMLGKHVRRDAVESFDEVSCASGGLSLVRGKELMYLVLNFLDRGKLWGLMDSPDDQPFTPGRAIPLEID